MLVDAAKYGDVEIPVFCYEPKLGQPVGACRMCLVEIEGIPKLQTALLDAGQGRHGRPHADRSACTTRSARSSSSCSSTTRSTARSATRAASARCRTSPTAGARGTLALHRAQAPLQEAARALAADRDRPRALHPLLPLRALLAGDLRGLPAGPARARRAHVRRHVRRPPVRRAVQRQHHRAVPGGRADLAAPTASARARGTSRAPGTVCTLLPGAVQRRAYRPRRARPARARPRQRRGRRRLAVRQGPLRLPGRPRRRAHHAPAGARGRRAARRSRWEQALERGRQRACERAGAASARWPAARRPTRRPSCCSASCARGSAPPHLDSRARAASCRSTLRARSPTPRCRRRSPTSSSPTPCSCSTSTRRRRCRSSTCASARACAATACSSPSPRRARRRSTRTPRCRCASRPGGGRAFAARSSPAGALRGEADDPASDAPRRRSSCCASAGEDVVVLAGRARAARGAPRAVARRRARPARPRRRRPARRARRRPTAAGCARSACCRTPAPACDPAESPAATRRHRRGARGRRARRRLAACTSTRCATSPTARVGARRSSARRPSSPTPPSSPTASREHADVVFPAEAYAEKEGTVTHPDGRVQRAAPGDRPPGRGARRRGRCSPTSPSASARRSAC